MNLSTRNFVFFSFCLHWLQDGVSSQNDGDLRLVGPTPNEGRVEIYHDFQWGTIADIYLLYDISKVVCRQLGQPTSGAEEVTDVNVYGPGTGPVWVDIAFCDGHEDRFTECRSFKWELFPYRTEHTEDIGVVCKEKSKTVPIVLGAIGGLAGLALLCCCCYCCCREVDSSTPPQQYPNVVLVSNTAVGNQPATTAAGGAQYIPPPLYGSSPVYPTAPPPGLVGSGGATDGFENGQSIPMTPPPTYEEATK